MKTITIEDIRKLNPCYNPNKYLPETWQGTILDVLNVKEAPFLDRLWVVLHTEFVSEKLMRLFAVWCARQVQYLMKDERSLRALDVAEKFANGEASKEELAAAASAAWDAASAAARAAWYTAWDAAWDAALDAARDAARAAARDAARDARDAASAAWYAARDAARDARDAASAAWYTAWDAARAAARDAQEIKIKEMIISGNETGDVF